MSSHDKDVDHLDQLPETYHGFLGPQIRAWFDEVQLARAKAYCPYSSFPVGALVIPKPPSQSTTTGLSPTTSRDSAPHAPSTSLPSTSSKTFTPFYPGANIENAAYPVGTCAERVAIGNAVVNGGLRPGDIAAVVVITKNVEPASPCGMCRQFINEFCGKGTPVFMFGSEGKIIVRTVGELLPLGFGGEDLK